MPRPLCHLRQARDSRPWDHIPRMFPKQWGHSFPSGIFNGFKRTFKFADFTYCFFCGSPQDRKFRLEAPIRHKTGGVKFSRTPCPWTDFTFAVVFSIWYTEGVRMQMISDFMLEEAMTYEQFVVWCSEDLSHIGEYTKMLEVFLWYCEMRLGPTDNVGYLSVT
jgi:hypothetical protein